MVDTSSLQNLTRFNAIVNPDGTPTEFFMRILQGSNGAIGEAALASLVLTAGTGLTGGGDLTQDRTFAIDTTTEAERIRDVIGAALVAGTNITITVNDAGDTITIAATGGGGGGGLYDISMGVPASLTQIGDATKFSWSQNSTKGANVKYGSGGVGPAVAGFVSSKTSGAAWQVAVLYLQNGVGARYYGTCIGLRNSSTSKLVTIVDFQGQANGIEFQKWNNPSSRSSAAGVTTGSADYPHAQGPGWLHLKDDGAGNIQFGRSTDGANPIWLQSTTTGDWVGSYDGIFFGGFFETNVNVPGVSTSILCFDPNGASRVVGV